MGPISEYLLPKRGVGENFRNLLIGTAIAVAFLVPGILALHGQIFMSYGGAVTLVTLGSLVAVAPATVLFKLFSQTCLRNCHDETSTI